MRQSGQAIIEYVLLLVIVVSLFYGLSKSLFSPLQKYGSSVFTNTIACSFEYGQLPSEIISEDGCAPKYQGSGLTNTSHRDISKSSSKENEKDSKKKEEKSNKVSTSETSSEGSPGRSTTIYSKGSALQLGRNSGAEGKPITNSQRIEGETGGRFDLSESDYISRRTRRPILKPITGELESIILNNKKKKPGEVNRLIASTFDPTERKIKKFLVNKKKTSIDEDSAPKPWDIYSLLRVIIIFLIILAILLFVFFQISQIRKGSA